MSKTENSVIRWQVEDPQNRQIILKQSTYEDHVDGDHAPQDAAFRKKVETQVKNTVVSPDFIIADNPRNLYYKLVGISNEDVIKLKTMRVVVDTDRTPNEVVTWVPMSKSKDTFKAEAIIYERGKDGLSDK